MSFFRDREAWGSEDNVCLVRIAVPFLSCDRVNERPFDCLTVRHALELCSSIPGPLHIRHGIFEAFGVL